jgi:hypothetical protein
LNLKAIDAGRCFAFGFRVWWKDFSETSLGKVIAF